MTDYVGSELETFAKARNWKSYVRSLLQPYLNGEVAEVGAGLGATTRALCDLPGVVTWTCIEPDAAMAGRIEMLIRTEDLPSAVRVHRGTLYDIPAEARFDTIIYIDVLEHIADDHSEMALAAERLRPSGRVIVVSPAYQFLYSPFDAAIGHHRRYNKVSLRRAAPKTLLEERMVYADAVGLAASLANKLLLQRSMPSLREVLVWDRLMVPLSRIIDPVLARAIGRSIIGIWTRPS